MNKRIIIMIISILIAVVFAGLSGYLLAYVLGLQKVNDTVVRHQSYTLQIDSLTLARQINSSGLHGFIDAVESNCENLASFIRANEPLVTSEDTRQGIVEALEAWETASDELQKFRALYSESSTEKIKP